ncbi:hypothetical protein GCM10011386_39750 [Parapedobacter defluvii]|uniref:Uncharacterized protein n=1 Tax=Parapedobacter defluvii TaxID=2045106 RepID=A0ABQ1MNR7_9SPHI|nr:hypothetical protein GCM10011386_39750 [Parapedobacter defluvii]
MAKVTPELFEVLNDSKVEITLTRLYRAALQQGWSMVLHFLPKVFKLPKKTKNKNFKTDVMATALKRTVPPFPEVLPDESEQ